MKCSRCGKVTTHIDLVCDDCMAKWQRLLDEHEAQYTAHLQTVFEREPKQEAKP